jgi:hypothetical protein
MASTTRPAALDPLAAQISAFRVKLLEGGFDDAQAFEMCKLLLDAYLGKLMPALVPPAADRPVDPTQALLDDLVDGLARTRAAARR